MLIGNFNNPPEVETGIRFFVSKAYQFHMIRDYCSTEKELNLRLAVGKNLINDFNRQLQDLRNMTIVI